MKHQLGPHYIRTDYVDLHLHGWVKLGIFQFEDFLAKHAAFADYIAAKETLRKR